MSSETPLLVQFSRGAAPTGAISKDGLPVYEPAVMITLERPPLLHLHRRATVEEQEEYVDAYKAFLKTEHAKSMNVEGYPLAMWPVINEEQLTRLAGRDVFTVEQLAKLNARKDLPPELAELAMRAKKFIDLQASSGKFEAMILDRDRQIDALTEENQTLKRDVARLNKALGVIREKVEL